MNRTKVQNSIKQSLTFPQSKECCCCCCFVCFLFCFVFCLFLSIVLFLFGFFIIFFFNAFYIKLNPGRHTTIYKYYISQRYTSFPKYCRPNYNVNKWNNKKKQQKNNLDMLTIIIQKHRLEYGFRRSINEKRIILRRFKETRKVMFYLTTHSTHFIYGYMASDIWLRTILIVRKETRCSHIGYSLRLAARVLLYAPSHIQDSTYYGLCYTSRWALAGTRNSSMGSKKPVSFETHIHTYIHTHSNTHTHTHLNTHTHT